MALRLINRHELTDDSNGSAIRSIMPRFPLDSIIDRTIDYFVVVTVGAVVSNCFVNDDFVLTHDALRAKPLSLSLRMTTKGYHD
jgi:hypothetical protein